MQFSDPKWWAPYAALLAVLLAATMIYLTVFDIMAWWRGEFKL